LQAVPPNAAPHVSHFKPVYEFEHLHWQLGRYPVTDEARLEQSDWSHITGGGGVGPAVTGAVGAGEAVGTGAAAAWNWKEPPNNVKAAAVAPL